MEGRAYFGGKLQPICIGIANGKIARIRKVLKGERHLDFNDRIILPTAIDVHTHMREPGMTKKEDFSTGTISAAFGGVTCIFDMPNTLPPTVLKEDALEKKVLASQKSWVDFGIFGGCRGSSNPARTVNEVVGFKIFMSSTTGSVLLAEDRDIKRILDLIKGTKKVVSVHAEDDHLIGRKEEASLRDHETNRPIAAEVSAIERLTKLSGGTKINVCHITSTAGLEMAAKGTFTCEATPHHLLLDISNMKGRKAYAKVNPPLRKKEERDALFQAFAQGKVDMLASDHAPHTIEDKEQEFSSAPSGCPGVETSFPLMMALVKRNALALPTLIRAACERPAEIFGLNKGKIEEGRDADLMVLDPRNIAPINGNRLHSKCCWTLYEGYEAIFPEAVFLRGAQLIEDGALVGERMGRDVVVRPRAPG